MPIPVSITWISANSPRLLTPTRMRPSRVYLMALETRFWISRRKRLRSVMTPSDDGMIFRPSFFSAASGRKSLPIWPSSPPRLKAVSSGFNAPASSREMSSTAPKMVSTDSSEDSMLMAALPAGPLPAFSISEEQ